MNHWKFVDSKYTFSVTFIKGANKSLTRDPDPGNSGSQEH